MKPFTFRCLLIKFLFDFYLIFVYLNKLFHFNEIFILAIDVLIYSLLYYFNYGSLYQY